MKSLLILTFTFFLVNGFSQSNCTPYLPITMGSSWEVTSYSAKDKETGKVVYELINIVETDTSTLFRIKAETFDKKGEKTYTNQYKAYCKNGKFDFDMAFMIDGESMQAYQNMDVKVDASELEIPTMETPPGTSLKDGNLDVRVSTGDITVFKMNVKVTERKLETIEEITTSAGTFKCLKITQKINTKMLVRIEGTSTEWYAENIGIIRSESYNKNGKLTGYDLLTKLEVK